MVARSNEKSDRTNESWQALWSLADGGDTRAGNTRRIAATAFKIFPPLTSFTFHISHPPMHATSNLLQLKAGAIPLLPLLGFPQHSTGAALVQLRIHLLIGTLELK